LPVHQATIKQLNKLTYLADSETKMCVFIVIYFTLWSMCVNVYHTETKL